MTATIRPHRWFGSALLALAVLLVLNTVLGPLVLGRLDYDLSDSLTNQLIGLEVVTVALVVPWTVGAGVLALRGHPAAPILGFAPAAYTAYMFVQYVLGPEYGDYRLAPFFHLVLFALAGTLLFASWSLQAPAALPEWTRRTRRRRELVLAALATFVVLRYLPAVAGAFRGTDLPSEFAYSVTFYWSIVLLDLGVVVPAVVAAALALHRGAAGSRRAFFAVVGWFALVPPSVAAMALTMLVRDDPNGSWATVTLLTVAAAAFAGYAVAVHRPLLALR